MTAEEIAALVPGLDFDRAIAEHVMGIALEKKHGFYPGFDRVESNASRWSTDPAASYRMEEHLQERGLAAIYGRHLRERVGDDPFALAHASPADRGRSALLAVLEARTA